MNYDTKKHITFFISLSLLSSCATSNIINKNLSDINLIKWGEEESTKRFIRSLEYGVDFFPLSNNFVSQDNGIVCGLASSAIVLNALRLRKKENLPIDESSISKVERKYLPKNHNPFFQKYTPNNVLNNKIKSKLEVLGKPTIINGKLEKDFGIQLDQLSKTLETHGLSVAKRVVDNKLSLNEIRAELIQNLKTQNDYILVNYSRKALGQEGGGHISPVAAYDKTSDSFLILDVSPNKAPWVWVNTNDLIKAMNTFDTLENRGYLFISDK